MEIFHFLKAREKNQSIQKTLSPLLSFRLTTRSRSLKKFKNSDLTPCKKHSACDYIRILFFEEHHKESHERERQ